MKRWYPFLLVWFSCQAASPPTFSEFQLFWQTAPTIDLWLKGGQVLDGTGAAAFQADVCIVADTIAFVGQVDTSLVVARDTFDARGFFISPGLIDAHVHGNPKRTPAFQNFLAQGVTTICLGQDGNSPSPSDLASYLRKGSLGTSPNLAYWVGHGTLRQTSGTGFNPHPSPSQQSKMDELLAQAMQTGAFGLSTGLEYTPGLYAPESELVALAKVVGQYDGLIMSHLRNEDDEELLGAIDELLLQGRHCRVHISHLKSVYGKGTQRAAEILAYLSQARSSGIELTADLYPYSASYTTIGIVFPDWARPPNDYQRVLRQRRAELAAYLRNRVQQRNGPEATLFGSGPYASRTLAEVAKSQGRSFEEVLLDIGPTGASAAYFVMDEVLQKRLAQWPWLMFSSDGSPTMRHPRGHGSFATVLGDWVGPELPLAEAIRKMTVLPAQSLGIKRRGQIKTGYFADIIAFTPEQVTAKATFAVPNQLAQGMQSVWINGVQVWENERFLEQFPGRVLKRGK